MEEKITSIKINEREYETTRQVDVQVINEGTSQLRLPSTNINDDITQDVTISASCLSSKDKKKCAKLIAQVLKTFNIQRHASLKLEGSTKERITRVDVFFQTISIQSLDHPALVQVFSNTKARALTTPSKAWVNKALFSIFYVLLNPRHAR